MPSVKIKKGLNIPMQGIAEKVLEQKSIEPETVALKPVDFPFVTPKPLIKEGDTVKTGDSVFYDKYNPEIKFTSPVSGTLRKIVRGERRKILEFVIESDEKQEYKKFDIKDLSVMTSEDIAEILLQSGTWPFIKQRPYDTIADPKIKPKAVFISGFDSSPLAPDYDLILNGQDSEFQKGIDVIKKLTDTDINITIHNTLSTGKIFSKTKDVILHTISGPHPSGNVGIQIHHINPINKGEVVWHINPQDVVIIGRLFHNGILDTSKIIALTGSEVLKPKYYKAILGTSIDEIVKNNIKQTEEHLRYISGNVLTGTKIESNGYLGFYHNQITVIPEGDNYEMFGWALPGFSKYSTSRSFFSWLMPNKKFRLNANIHGGERPFVFSEEYEKVLPMDIYPVYLLKSIMIEDIDQMEALGIYEVGEEDFALCEFVCTSKIPVQNVLRKGFQLMIKETN
jgi:Na+-transporting NADH:ubiquinone oxidoreductase subunit A